MAANRFVFGATVVAAVLVLVVLQLCLANSSDARGSARARSTSSRPRAAQSASRGNGRGRGLGSSAGQMRIQEQELPYYMVCPEVHCPELPPGCQTIEFIAYDRQYEVRGKGIVTVRCRSCEYCLDIPAHLLSSRAIGNGEYEHLVQSAKDRMPCSNVRCPVLPDTCIDVRLTNVFIGGQQCGQCPACYDRNAVNFL